MEVSKMDRLTGKIIRINPGFGGTISAGGSTYRFSDDDVEELGSLREEMVVTFRVEDSAAFDIRVEVNVRYRQPTSHRSFEDSEPVVFMRDRKGSAARSQPPRTTETLVAIGANGQIARIGKRGFCFIELDGEGPDQWVYFRRTYCNFSPYVGARIVCNIYEDEQGRFARGVRLA